MTASIDTTPPGPADRRLRVIAGSVADGAEILAVLDRTPIRVVLPNGSPEWRHQVIALALVDLLGRLFPHIEIVGDPDAASDEALPPGAPLLVGRLGEVAQHGGLHVSEPAQAVPITIVIGTAQPPADPSAVILHVDGGGWQSYNGTEPSRLPDQGWSPVPVGPLAAACRAAAQAAAFVLDPASIEHVRPSVYASALTYRSGEAPTDDGAAGPVAVWRDTYLDALLGGAGSVGGAAAYTFRMTPGLRGHLRVADPQMLEEKNLDRALLATALVTAESAWKSDVVAEALGHLELTVEVTHGTVAEWVATQPQGTRLPLVLAAVDSIAARREIQDCLPLDLINAACGVADVTVSGHRTGDGPCVCCLHMEDVLNAEQVKVRLLSRATGLNPRMVETYLIKRTPLEPHVVRKIESYRGLASGALAQYEQQSLDDLRRGELLYGATAVKTESGVVAVAAPYVTALAGVLLAGEALKAAAPELAAYRLGPAGSTKYEERVDRGPLDSLLSNPARWTGSECLCRSARRLRLLSERCGDGSP